MMGTFNYEKYWLTTNGYDFVTGKKKELNLKTDSQIAGLKLLNYL